MKFQKVMIQIKIGLKIAWEGKIELIEMQVN